MIRLSFYDDWQAESLNDIYRVIFAGLSEKGGKWADFRQAVDERRAQGDFYLGDGLLLPHCWWPGEPRLMFFRLDRPIAWEAETISRIIFFCLAPEGRSELRTALEICFREKGVTMFLRTKGTEFQMFLQAELKKGGIDYEI